MLNLSTCPRCKQLVRLPESGDGASRVRCPLCLVVYPLSDALALAPPELIVLPANMFIDASATTSKPVAGLVTEPFFVRGPTIAPPADGSTVEAPAEETSGSGLPEDFTLDFAEHLAEADSLEAESEESIEAAEIHPNNGNNSAAASLPSYQLPLNGRTSAEQVKSLPQVTHLLKPPPRNKAVKRHPIRFFMGLVVSAIVGLLIAYYGVWWIRGESAGFPRISWLPFLPAEEVPANILKKAIPSIADSNTLSGGWESDVEKQTPAVSANPIGTNSSLDRKAEKMAQDQVPPKTAEAPEPQVGPRSPAKFLAIDLDTAIDDVTGALFGKNGTGKVHEQSYPQFCRLAEVQTFIAPDKQLPGQKQTVQDFLAGIAQDPKQFAEIGRLAGEILKKAGEREGGILLAGKATKISSKNGLYGASVQLADGEDIIPVMSNKPLSFKEDDEVLVLGAMIPKPAENLAGYTGKKPLVIWLGAAARVAVP